MDCVETAEPGGLDRGRKPEHAVVHSHELDARQGHVAPRGGGLTEV